MRSDWGKLINGQIYIEDPIVIDNGKPILIDELEEKENFDIKHITYEEFPGIENGYHYSNYWINTPEGIIQKWKKEQIPVDPSGKLKVIYNQYESAVHEILQMIELLDNDNKNMLNIFFKENKLIKPIYDASAKIFGYGNVYKQFISDKYTIKQLFEEIGLHAYFETNGVTYVESGDFYQSKSGEVLIHYCYIKNNFYNIDSYINFTTTRNITYLKMSYIYLYTLFDEYLLKAIETISRVDARTMIKYISNISTKEIIESENKNEIITKMIEQLSYKMGWNSMQDKIEFLQNCGINLDNTMRDDLILIGEKRNVIVHNQGKVNLDFIKKISKTHYNSTYKIDDIINVDIEMIKLDSLIMKTHVQSIYKCICEKYSLLPYC